MEGNSSIIVIMVIMATGISTSAKCYQSLTEGVFGLQQVTVAERGWTFVGLTAALTDRLYSF